MHAKCNDANQSNTRDIFPKSGSESFSPQELEVPLSEVARYAGGSRYQMDSKMETLTRSILNQAISLCRPAFGYTAQKILDAVPDKGFLIENNILIPSPPDIPSDTVSVVSVICTIGPNLEKEMRSLNAKGMYLEMLYLDASGVALLEAVVQQAHGRISELARNTGLYCGCQWAPGCEKTSLEDQKILLAGAFGNYLNLEDCSTIGLLAGVDPDQVRVVGNAAGVGAVLTMFDEASGTELKKLAQLTKEINLSTHSEFQDTFVRNLSLHRFNH